MKSISKKPIYESLASVSFKKIFWEKCKENGILIEDLIDRTGLTYLKIYRIVKGKENTSFNDIIILIQAAGFQPTEILNFKIEIPDYPPLRREVIGADSEKFKKSPAARFFLKQFIENELFKKEGLTPYEVQQLINDDLNKEFDEKDFALEMNKFYKNKILMRRKENDTYRYFEKTLDIKK